MNSFPPALLLLGAALALPLLPRFVRGTAFLLVTAAALALLGYLEDGAVVRVQFLTFDMVPLRVDRLSLAFAYVFVLVAFLGGIYSFHLQDTGQRVAALVYAGSSLGAVFAGDLFTLFIFWETMAVSSAYLILARRTEPARRAGMRYIIVHLLGGSVLLAGILWHFADTGSLAFNAFAHGGDAYLILFGFAVNAAIPPLHAWLADAYPEGTVTGSVFLSAFTTKTAVYVLARGFAGWEILTLAGTVMAIYGVVFAFLQNDIRRVLAYHIVSQVGYMVAGIGIGSAAAINGSTAHAFAHILYKGLLFMAAGAVLYATGKSKMSELGGLSRSLPGLLWLYMVGAFSISALPLFSGFVSKSLVVYAAELNHDSIVVLLLNFASVGTFLSIGLKVPYFTWFGTKRAIEIRAVPWNMYAAMILAGAINVAIGIYPDLFYRVMPFPVAYRPYSAAHLSETLQLLAFTGLAFWLVIDKIQIKTMIMLDVDWFYRKPAPFLYRLSAVALNQFFTAAETLTVKFAHALAKFCADPIDFTSTKMAPKGARAAHPPAALSYDADRHRVSAGVTILVVLCSFVALLAWSLFVI